MFNGRQPATGLLPRAQTALRGAERSHFYKERARRHTEEALLQRRLAALQVDRAGAERRLRQRTAELRHLVLDQRDECRALHGADRQLLEAVAQKIETNKRRNFQQLIKYKSKNVQQQLRQQQQLLEEADTNLKVIGYSELAPAGHLQQELRRLDLRLIWPGLQDRGHYRRAYAQLRLQETQEAARRQRGDDCVRHLLERYGSRGCGVEDEAAVVRADPSIAEWSLSELSRRRLQRCRAPASAAAAGGVAEGWASERRRRTRTTKSAPTGGAA